MIEVARIPVAAEKAVDRGLPHGFALSRSENDPMASITTDFGAPARALSARQVDLVQDLHRDGLISELQKAGWLTPSHLEVHEGTTFLVQPELLPALHPGELPPAMRRDAARVILQISRSLDQHSYVLATADLSGIFLNRMGCPQFHDLLAIRRKDETGAFPYQSFHAAHLAPIRLLARQPSTAPLVHRAGAIEITEDIALRHPAVMRLSRLLGNRSLATFNRFAVASPFAGLLHAGLYLTFVREAATEFHRRRRGETAPPRWTARLIDRLIQETGRIKPSASEQHWTNYYARGDLATIAGARDDEWRPHYDDPRARVLIDQLGPAAGRSLLDIGSNQGYYAMLAAHVGFSVTAVDFDIAAIDALYGAIRAAGYRLPVRALVLDFVALRQTDYPRFRADAVLALGFIHHMRLVELLPWSVIVEKLAALTQDVLITEFKPGTKASAVNLRGPVDDYDLDSFIAALRSHFSAVEVVGSHTAPGSPSPRQMIVCRR